MARITNPEGLFRWECYDCRVAKQRSRRQRWHGRWYEIANAADWYLEKHLERYDCNPDLAVIVEGKAPKETP